MESHLCEVPPSHFLACSCPSFELCVVIIGRILLYVSVYAVPLHRCWGGLTALKMFSLWSVMWVQGMAPTDTLTLPVQWIGEESLAGTLNDVLKDGRKGRSCTKANLSSCMFPLRLTSRALTPLITSKNPAHHHCHHFLSFLQLGWGGMAERKELLLRWPVLTEHLRDVCVSVFAVWTPSHWGLLEMTPLTDP